MKRIAFATSEAFPQLTLEDQALIFPLRELDIEAVPAVWTSPQVNWDDFDAVIIRSTWDYTQKLSQFMEWISGLEAAGIPLFNSSRIVRENVNKIYLKSLQEKGVPIVPTVWAEFESAETLLKQIPYEEFVVKPTVSAGGVRTYRMNKRDGDLKPFSSYAPGTLLMVQPYLAQIETLGEWSFLFFNGEFSHAVIKTPASGEFKIQEVFGGKAEKVLPKDLMLAQAQAVLKRLDETPLYARVDMIEDQGKLLLGELEMIEPNFFLRTDPEAAKRFARAFKNVVTNK